MTFEELADYVGSDQDVVIQAVHLDSSTAYSVFGATLDDTVLTLYIKRG